MTKVTDREHGTYYEITKFSLDPLNGLYKKEDITPYIKTLFSLTEKEFKGIKIFSALNAVNEDVKWVTKDTCGWVDFFLYYHLWQSVKKTDWHRETSDVKVLCENMKYLLVNTDAFAEKDGYFYILEDIKLIKEINLEWTFST